jgi:RNA-directed DNA polymerase
VIALEEGFALNFRKTRAMRPGHRQRLAGVVINVRPNVARTDFDRLKAILTNCVRSGPEGQNRDGHGDFRAYLLGKVALVAMLNPTRGAKLRAIFERIPWPDPPAGHTIPAG